MSSLAQLMLRGSGGDVSGEAGGFRPGERTEMDRVQRGIEIFPGTASEGRWIYDKTHTVLICAQPDNASQGQNSFCSVFLNWMFL